MSTNSFAIIPEEIILRSIKVLGGNIEADENIDPKTVSGFFDITFDVTSDVIPQEKLYRFILSIQIQALDNDEKPLNIKGGYKIEFIFFINNLPSFIQETKEENKTIIFHPILPNTLAGIIYSTSRGIVWSRTQGTSLEGVILPVIDPKELFPKFAEGQDLQAPNT